ncbi:MAG: tetratricopeptide repeat protein [Caldithrix sp.]|nr:tetratricopeptide repeat protein [Caldithrix sp.]
MHASGGPMKRFSSFILILTILFGGFIFQNCAGTKGGGDESTASSNDEDLEDIEALLGISSEEPEETTPQQSSSQSQDEKLSLLDSEADRNQQQTDESLSPAEKRRFEDQIRSLKNQLQQKDREINRLRDQLQAQESEIQQSAQSSKNSDGSAFSASGLSNISMAEYESRYDQGRQLFESRNYREAIEVFEALISASATHSLADNAQFWIGECHYGLRQYEAAILDFEKVFTFPNSNKHDDAQFKLGVCYLRKGDRQKAVEEFNRLRNDYPDSEFISRIDPILAQF